MKSWHRNIHFPPRGLRSNNNKRTSWFHMGQVHPSMERPYDMYSTKRPPTYLPRHGDAGSEGVPLLEELKPWRTEGYLVLWTGGVRATVCWCGSRSTNLKYLPTCLLPPPPPPPPLPPPPPPRPAYHPHPYHHHHYNDQTCTKPLH